MAYLVFIDFLKAFNNLNHQVIREVLKVEELMSMPVHQTRTTPSRVDNQIADKAGVRQG